MSQELQSLLDKINEEGVKKASAERDSIVADARRAAAKIIADATEEARKITEDARTDADALVKRSEESIRQSSRDVLLALKNELENRLAKVVKSATGAALTPEFMAGLIRELTGAFISAKGGNVTVISAVRDRDALDKALDAAMGESFRSDGKIFADKELRGGFQIGFDNDELFFDFSDEAVTELVSSYANARLRNILKA